MNEETHALLKEIAEEAATQAVENTLLKLGFNLEDVTEIQADMAAVRNWRKAQVQIRSTTRTAAIWVLVSGFAAIILLGVKSWFLN
jgi:hypothetical protein